MRTTPHNRRLDRHNAPIIRVSELTQVKACRRRPAAATPFLSALPAEPLPTSTRHAEVLAAIVDNSVLRRQR
jgi:hypothetical protein